MNINILNIKEHPNANLNLPWGISFIAEVNNTKLKINAINYFKRSNGNPVTCISINSSIIGIRLYFENKLVTKAPNYLEIRNSIIQALFKELESNEVYKSFRAGVSWP